MMSASGEKEGQKDNECTGSETGPRPNLSSYKLLVDPVLQSGKEKLCRYDGLHFSAPNPGFHPPEVRDPRIARFWTKFKETDLPVPKFKVDENYVGPPKEVTFARLNDNIKAGFLTDMCQKFGEITEAEVLFNPNNKKHLGIAKVIFATCRGANDAVQRLHATTVMGNRIHVELDPKGEKRMRYFQLLVSGLYTPFTLPLGEDAWGPQSPTYSSDSHNDYDPVKRLLSHGSLSSSLLGSTPFDCSTPMSMDTAYSSMHQDTPCSFFQDTPHGSPTFHSNPGTPSHSEGLANATDTQTDTHASKGAPLITSESQHSYHNPYLVQLTPPTANTGQRSSTSITPRTSQGRMVSHKVGRAPRGGNRGHVWGAKYQNAYNRRLEHRYVHRPGFNRSHYRSGCTTNLVPLVTFQGPSAVHTHQDESPNHCGRSLNKPSSQTATEAPSASVDREPTLPASQKGNLCQIQTLCSQTLGTSLDVRLKTPDNSFISPPHLPVVQQQDGTAVQTPERCTSPEPERSLSTEQEPSSLDSRIKMLLGTHSPDPGENKETLVSGDWASPKLSETSSKYDPLSPKSRNASPTLGFPAAARPCSPTHQNSVMPGSEKVRCVQDSDSAGTEEETQPGSTIPVISNFCSASQPAPQPRHQTSLNLPFPRQCTSAQPSQPGTDSSPAPSVFPLPPPPLLLPPPGFPTLPLPVLTPTCSSAPCPVLPPVPVRITSPPPNLSVPPTPFFLPPKIPTGQTNRPPRWANPLAPPPSAPLPIPTRITQGKSHTVFPPPFAITPPLAPFPCVDGARKAPCPTSYSAAVPGFRAPWPPACLPAFGPSVPPPDYLPMTKSLHQATVDGVMAAVAAELRLIVRRDIYRRMIEAVAFAAFDQWWDSAKTSMVSVKSGERKEKAIAQPRISEPAQTAESTGSEVTLLGTGLGLGLPSVLKLPSFKVKRKDPSAEDAMETEKARVSSSSGHTLSEEAASDKRGSSPCSTAGQDGAADESQQKESVSVAKRRHARPPELDSDDDEEEENTGNRTGNMNHSNTNQDDDEGEEDEVYSDREVISIASSDSPSTTDYESTLCSRSDSPSSDGSRYSSDREESDEDGGGGPSSQALEEERAAEVIWISSDDDDEEYESRTRAGSSADPSEDEPGPPLTPSAPLSDGDPDDHLLGADAHEELRVQVFLHSYGCQDPVSQHLSNKLELSDPAMLPSACESPELQCPPSPTYREFSTDEGLESDFNELLEDSGTLRPPTPTGSLSESEPELELRMSPPAADDAELPCTPGGSCASDAETPALPSAPTPPLPPPPSPTGFHLFPSPPLYLSPPPLPSSYPAYEETPKTPGRNNREESIHHTAAQTMATHSPFSPSFPSVSPHTGSGVPRTPGRDLHPSSPLSEDSEVRFQRQERWRSRRPRSSRQTHIRSTGSSPYSSDRSGSQTGESSSPASPLRRVQELRKRRERIQRRRRTILSHGDRRSKDAFQHTSARGSVAKPSSYDGPSYRSNELAAKTPLQGLENRLQNRLQQSEDPRLPDTLYPWRNRKSWPHSSAFAPRSRRRERLLIKAVWTKGVNKEEIGHLKASYERMLLQNNTFDWLRNTHWAPHPPSSVPLEWPPKLASGARYHASGCARTEGFYAISKRDKLRYLRHTHAAPGHPGADAQHTHASAPLPSSSRSGADFRAEQRRLLSSFSCDSDLLKFNQLKFRKKRLRFSRSRIHDWGLFAEEPIAADEMVIEYVGQSIRQVMADMRERRYEQEGIGSSYLFRVDQDTIIDATKCGNLARFINHSCNPNCYAKVVTVESKKKIVIYSRQSISVNEEITYDYKFPIEDEKIPCLCGAENCRGTLN